MLETATGARKQALLKALMASIMFTVDLILSRCQPGAHPAENTTRGTPTTAFPIQYEG